MSVYGNIIRENNEIDYMYKMIVSESNNFIFFKS